MFKGTILPTTMYFSTAPSHRNGRQGCIHSLYSNIYKVSSLLQGFCKITLLQDPYVRKWWRCSFPHSEPPASSRYPHVDHLASVCCEWHLLCCLDETSLTQWRMVRGRCIGIPILHVIRYSYIPTYLSVVVTH